MKVNNDFPNVDRVISKLKSYVDFFENKKNHGASFEEYNYALEEVDNFIVAIENYLDSVCNMQDRIRKFKEKSNSVSDVQQYIMDEDDKRTRHHSSIIMSMVLIDRIANANQISKVFDYAEEFESDYSKLTPSTKFEKSQMSERERTKRREMGNFGLYIAASVSVGLKLEDREIREFASCESDYDYDSKNIAFDKVKKDLKKSEVSNNMNDMIK